MSSGSYLICASCDKLASVDNKEDLCLFLSEHTNDERDECHVLACVGKTLVHRILKLNDCYESRQIN